MKMHADCKNIVIMVDPCRQKTFCSGGHTYSGSTEFTVDKAFEAFGINTCVQFNGTVIWLNWWKLITRCPKRYPIFGYTYDICTVNRRGFGDIACSHNRDAFLDQYVRLYTVDSIKSNPRSCSSIRNKKSLKKLLIWYAADAVTIFCILRTIGHNKPFHWFQYSGLHFSVFSVQHVP